jgi:hypothetical protein
VKIRSNLAESFKEGYGSKRAVLPMMMMLLMMMMTTKGEKETLQMRQTSVR